ncbi:MAG: hypothetical protein HC859_00450 [Bacteroidia bacterium]|nr:hypothetical protein [Bacteroidia bacterium]
MDEKINLTAVESYCNAYANEVMDGYFSSRTHISGQDILSLCNIKQINFFVLHEVFKAWKTETAKIKSPYFNYDHPEVKEALDNLMSILSNNISVSKENFSPLLKQATFQTMLLVLDPYDFFSDLISDDRGPLTTDTFREQLKYLRINKAPLEKLLERLDAKDVKQIQGNEAFGMLDQILEELSFTPEDVEGYLDSFSARVPLNIEHFYEPKVQPRDEVKKAPAPQPKTETSPTINEAQVNKTSTVNEKLNSQRPTLADNFKRIGKIKDSLTINQKFMFTKVLFHGDFELFSKAVDDIDRLETINAALRYLEDNYEEWDRESEEFHEFMEMVEKRFS